jgi:hypothetical protein
MDDYTWVYDVAAVDLEELSRLYRIAPLGDKPPQTLATVPFYARLGFLRMNTAMAIWRDPARAIETGLLTAAP